MGEGKKMFSAGELVRLKNDPSTVGTVGREPAEEVHGRTFLWIDFPTGRRKVPSAQLEAILAVADPFEDLKRGKLSAPSDLRRVITHLRMTGRLADMIYSLGATNTEFHAYQFKPVLKLLNSPSRGLLIADEVGLGKTIEAGLVWTELVARFDCRRLLIICPKPLCEKWRDELRSKFNVLAQIKDAKGLLQTLKDDSEHREGFAVIASMPSLRPPKGWSDPDEDVSGPRADLAEYLAEAGDDLFDLVVIDEPGASQLIARPEELDCLNPSVRSLFQVQTLDSRATEFEEGDEEAADTGNLEGLHAKAYVVERGSRLHIHLGSANATVAALVPTKSGRTQNVEVMAELAGPKTRMGTIEQALFSEGFKRLLIPYEPSEAPTEDARLAAEKLLDRLRREIAAVPLDLNCTELDDLVGLEVSVAGAVPVVELPDGVACFLRPITVANLSGHDAAALFQARVPLAVGHLPLGDVTRWLGVRLHHQPTNIECSFTLGTRLVDLPEGRDAAVLSAYIANAENFFRYLSLLLGSLGEGSFLEGEAAGEGQWLQRFGQGGSSLLEPMVRALNMGGDELREIDALLRRLDSPEGDGNIVPEEFRELWASFAPLLGSSKARR